MIVVLCVCVLTPNVIRPRPFGRFGVRHERQLENLVGAVVDFRVRELRLDLGDRGADADAASPRAAASRRCCRPGAGSRTCSSRCPSAARAALPSACSARRARSPAGSGRPCRARAGRRACRQDARHRRASARSSQMRRRRPTERRSCRWRGRRRRRRRRPLQGEAMGGEGSCAPRYPGRARTVSEWSLPCRIGGQIRSTCDAPLVLPFTWVRGSAPTGGVPATKGRDDEEDSLLTGAWRNRAARGNGAAGRRTVGTGQGDGT